MSDPKRLFQSEDELGGLLRAGKSEVPSEANMDALAAKLGALGLFDGGGFDGGGGAGGDGGGATALKGGAASAVKGGAGAAAAAAKGGLAVKILSGVALATALGGGVVVATKVQAPVPVEAPSTGLVARPPTSSSSSSLASAPSLAPLVLEDPLPSAIPSVKVVKVAPSASASSEPEVKMLARAQDALRGQPAEALAIADEHARRYPSGMLAQEREVIAIEALVKSGRTADARARAARFEQRFPGSAQISRVRSLVGISP